MKSALQVVDEVNNMENKNYSDLQVVLEDYYAAEAKCNEAFFAELKFLILFLMIVMIRTNAKKTNE